VLAGLASVGRQDQWAPLQLLGVNVGGAATAATFELGGVNAEKLPLVIMDHPTIEALEEMAGQLDGLVGFTFFARYSTIVDYQKGEIIFVRRAAFEPENVLQKLMGELRASADGKPRHALLGITVTRPEGGAAGALVAAVAHGGAAAAAGVVAGDRILSVNGEDVGTAERLLQILRGIAPGETIHLKLARAGNTIEFAVKTKELPGGEASRKVPRRSVVLGLRLEDGGGDVRGAVAESIAPGSAADAAGLRKGDRIVGLDERWIENAQDLNDGVATLAPAQTVLLKVVRAGEAIELRLKTRAGL
jgi:S1-C subfamily serine protease